MKSIFAVQICFLRRAGFFMAAVGETCAAFWAARALVRAATVKMKLVL